MNYSHTFFKENLPSWKKAKDSFLVRHFFRPISFYTSSIFVKLGFSAHDVSYFSVIIAILGSLCYIFNSNVIHIVGAILMNFWMILDCTDGNIARCVKKEKFGEFADASSSYIFINCLFFCLGIAAYRSEGLILSLGTWPILVLGGLAGSSDSLARLLYQKYENVSRDYKKENNDNVEKSNKGSLVKIHDRVDKELGQNGIFLPSLLICSIFSWFDIFVIFYFVFYFSTFILSFILLIKKSKG